MFYVNDGNSGNGNSGNDGNVLITLTQFSDTYGLNKGTVSKRLQTLYAPTGVDVKAQGGLTRENVDRLSKSFRVGPYANPSEVKTLENGGLSIVDTSSQTSKALQLPEVFDMAIDFGGEDFLDIESQQLDMVLSALNRKTEQIQKYVDNRAEAAKQFKAKVVEVEKAVTGLRNAQLKAEMFSKMQDIIATSDNAKMQDLLGELVELGAVPAPKA